MAPFVDCVELLAMMVQSRPFACQHILALLLLGWESFVVELSLKIGFVVVVDFVVCFGKFVEMQEKIFVEIEEKLVARESSELG
ncbi:hypothetical protein Tco_0392738 [Tanacetum coccineum]